MAALNAAAPRITDRLCDACADALRGGPGAPRRARRAVSPRARARARPGLLHADRVRVLRRAAARASSRRSAAAAATTGSSSCSAGGRPRASGSGIGLDRLVLALDGAGPRRRCAEPAPGRRRRRRRPGTTRSRGSGSRRMLRAAGIAARAELGRRKLGKQLEAAARDAAHFAVIVGDELADGEVQLRDLPAGTQKRRRRSTTSPASSARAHAAHRHGTEPAGRSAKSGAGRRRPRPDRRRDRARPAGSAWPGGLEALLDPAFAEVGASGRRLVPGRCSRGAAGRRSPDRIELRRPRRRSRLADDVALVRFGPWSGPRPPGDGGSRSGCGRDGTWRLRYHQGTVVPVRRPAG